MADPMEQAFRNSLVTDAIARNLPCFDSLMKLRLMNKPLNNSIVQCLRDTITLDYSNDLPEAQKLLEKRQNFRIGNILKLFPAAKLSIIFPKGLGTFQTTAQHVGYILRKIWTANVPNLIVNVHFYPQFDERIVRSPLAYMHRYGEKVAQIDVGEEQLRDGDLVGKQIIARYPVGGGILMTMTLWLDKTEFEEYFHKLTVNREHRNSLRFTRQFLDPTHLEGCALCQEVIRNDETGGVPPHPVQIIGEEVVFGGDVEFAWPQDVNDEIVVEAVVLDNNQLI